MEIETKLHPNCSEYTLILTNLNNDSIAKIRELEQELTALRDLSEEEYARLTKEPALGGEGYTSKQWCDAYGVWSALPEVIAYNDRVDERWNKLRSRYTLANGETIFDTKIRKFHWYGNTLVIDGWLNEENFVEWLETVAGVEELKMRGGY